MWSARLKRFTVGNATFINDEMPENFMETVTSNETEQMLLEDPHVVEIRYDGPWVHGKVEPNLWVVRRRPIVEGILRGLGRFLDLPYIIDDFGEDHPARINWRNGLGEKTQRYLVEKNVLMGNNLVCVAGNVEVVGIGYIGPNAGTFAEHRARILEQFPYGIYHTLTVGEQMNVVGNIKNSVWAMLSFLAEQRATSESPKRLNTHGI